MMQLVSTKKNVALIVFNIGDSIHFTPLEKFNPNTLDARSPRFDGSFDECVNYCHNIL